MTLPGADPIVLKGFGGLVDYEEQPRQKPQPPDMGVDPKKKAARERKWGGQRSRPSITKTAPHPNKRDLEGIRSKH